MALIGKIRKNFWFVLLLLGLALAAFIMMDMSGSGGPGGAVRSLNMGNVAGQKINYKEFSQTEQAYFRNSGTDVFQKRKEIWNFYVEDALIKNEAEALGLNISKDELLDLQFGPTPSPIIQRNWANPQTGQVDVAQLQSYKTAIENGDPLNPEFAAYWKEQEKQIVKSTLQDKLTSIINKGVYTPSWMAEESYKMENSKTDFKYVKIPFDNIDGSDIELTDSDFTSYMNKYKSLYEETEETRVAEYATFNVVASEEDKEEIRESLESLKTSFLATDNDSLFAFNNRGSYSHIYGTKDQLPEVAREEIAALEPGEAYGPFEDNGAMLVVKLLDKRSIPDSVEAKHILRTTTPNDPASLEAATAFIDSITNVYKRGRKSFTDLAVEHSQDPSAATNKGDLGKFNQSLMVREFSDVCFLTGKEGGVYKVATQYGVHLIKIEDQIYNNREDKYKVATVGEAIVPSQVTQDEMYDKVSEIITNNRTYESLKAAVDADPDVSFQTTPPLKKNDFSIGSLGSGQTSRDLIVWMFSPNTEVNDISPTIYRYTDPVNYYDNKYVIAVLNRINPEGLKSVESVKDQIEVAVMNKKKGDKLASELSVTSLEDVATANNVEVQTASDVSMLAEFVQGIGNEPKVIGAAFELDPQSISKPIVGNSGVFVIQPLSTQEAGAPNNIPFLKSSLSTSTKSQVSFKILENMKKRADITDNRSTFY
ncbi:MAG: hypothetical protein HKO66_15835 [Saprospiraceae bacterium]|nr:hypothetical protein [Saprospiraceae bacterium]